jgi:hypothetical protein
VLNYSTTPWIRIGEWIYRSTVFFYLGSSWRWVVCFTLLLLYSRGKSLGGWIPEPMWTIWRSGNFFTPPGLELLPAGRPVRSHSLYRLRYQFTNSVAQGIWNLRVPSRSIVPQPTTLPFAPLDGVASLMLLPLNPLITSPVGSQNESGRLPVDHLPCACSSVRSP